LRVLACGRAAFVLQVIPGMPEGRSAHAVVR